MHETEPARRIRARHTAETITVYQAYDPAIGPPAETAYTPAGGLGA